MIKAALPALALLALTLPACTTVSIGGEPSSSPITATAVKARTAVKRSAQTLLYVFSKEKWCPEQTSSESQSAASILLKGFKRNETQIDNVEDYIRSTASTGDVITDMSTAKSHVDTITLQASALLSDNPDIESVTSELTVLEKALISSRQAEQAFTRALSVKGNTEDSRKQLAAFTGSVDDLKAVTDTFGMYARGHMDQFTAG